MSSVLSTLPINVASSLKSKVFTSTVTITFGDVAENNPGMQKLGKLSQEGFTVAELKGCQEFMESHGIKCEYIDLHLDGKSQNAGVLIIRNGADVMLGKGGADKLLEEQSKLEVDKKAKMRGKVKNKLARHNLCFDDVSQEPNYEEGKGRVVSFDDIPFTKAIREGLPGWFGDKAKELKAEGNYYYDLKKCGISFHGDAERRKVVAVRLGATMPLHFHWFLWSKPVGSRFEVELNHGDMYVMSEVAVGSNWMTRKIPTLRHAAGCKKYLAIKSDISTAFKAKLVL